MTACPTCGAAAGPQPDNAHAPFCSRRCRLLDLGKWLNEDYRIPDPGPADMEQPPRRDGGAP